MNVVKIKSNRIIYKKGKTIKEWFAEKQLDGNMSGCFIGGKMKKGMSKNGEDIFVVKEAVFKIEGLDTVQLSNWFYKISYDRFAGISVLK